MDARLSPIELTNEGQKILAAGPQTRQPGTMEYRIVLLQHKDESFSVHSQIFEGPNYHFLVGGKYFPSGKDGFSRAIKSFCETVSNQAICYASIFRPPVESIQPTYNATITNEG